MLATIGHNKPPSEMEILQQRLQDYKQEQADYERLAAKEIPGVIENEQEAGKLTDHIKAVKSLQKKIGDIHKNEKQIYLECGRIVDGWKNTFETNLTMLTDRAMSPLQAFLDKKAAEERARQLELAKKAREEADKLAAEAEAHANEGIEDTANDLMDAALQSEAKADLIQDSAYDARARARSMSGASASQKLVWDCDIEARPAVDYQAIGKYFTDDDIKKACRAAIRDGVREVRGMKIYQKTQISVR